MYAYVYALALSLFDQHQTSMLTGRTVPNGLKAIDFANSRIEQDFEIGTTPQAEKRTLLDLLLENNSNGLLSTKKLSPGSGGGGDDRHDRITRIRVGSRGMSCIKLV